MSEWADEEHEEFYAGDADDPECTCVQIDVDLLDSRDCAAHGPNSEMAKRIHRAEAQDEADAAEKMGILLGFDREAAE